jgi:L-arabinose isomerase
MTGLEYLLVDRETTLKNFQKELRWNDAYYHLADGL